MKKHVVFFSIFILLIFDACMQSKVFTNQIEDNSLQVVKSWKVGTSSGVFTDYSQNEFDVFKTSGIKYVELGLSVFRNKSAKECEDWIKDFKQKADNAGIEIWSIHLPFGKVQDISSVKNEDRNNMIAECSRLMALLKPLNPHKFVIHPSSEPISDDERPIRLENCISSLKILTEEVKKYNAQLVVEDLPRTCLGNNSEEILTIVKAVGNGLGVCFDSNHLLKETPEKFAGNVGNLIASVHISDYDGIDERHWLPGEGIINWNNVISTLAKNGYMGPFMYETSRRKPAPDATTEEGKLTSMDLFNNFQELKNNFIKSLNGQK